MAKACAGMIPGCISYHPIHHQSIRIQFHDVFVFALVFLMSFVLVFIFANWLLFVQDVYFLLRLDTSAFWQSLASHFWKLQFRWREAGQGGNTRRKTKTIRHQVCPNWNAGFEVNCQVKLKGEGLIWTSWSQHACVPGCSWRRWLNSEEVGYMYVKDENLPNAEKMYLLPVLQKSTKFEDKWQWHSLIPSISKPRPVWSNEICCFSMICGEFVEIPVESSESSSPRLPSQ